MNTSTLGSSWWMERITGDPAVSKLLELVAEGGEVSARGVAGSSTTMLVAAISRRAPGPVVMVVRPRGGQVMAWVQVDF